MSRCRVQAAAGQRSSCLQSLGKPLELQFPRLPVVFPGACPLGAEGPGAVGKNDAGFQEHFALDPSCQSCRGACGGGWTL